MTILPAPRKRISEGDLAPGPIREWRHRIKRTVSADQSIHSFVVQGSDPSGATLAGATQWRSLPWDSGVFGYPAARLECLAASENRRDVLAALCLAVLEDASCCGIRHLTARVSSLDPACIEVLKHAGFEPLDAIQTFHLTLAGPARPWEPGAALIRGFQPADLEAVIEIARTSYIHDRFHADRSLPSGAADRVHLEWVRNSCQGDMADYVVVAELDERIAGYVTCKINRSDKAVAAGVIPLVATAAWARGRGIARAMTLGALDWFRSHGAASVEVGTQLQNEAAVRLYESCGFRVKGTAITLRKLLDGSPGPEHCKSGKGARQ